MFYRSSLVGHAGRRLCKFATRAQTTGKIGWKCERILGSSMCNITLISSGKSFSWVWFFTMFNTSSKANAHNYLIFSDFSSDFAKLELKSVVSSRHSRSIFFSTWILTGLQLRNRDHVWMGRDGQSICENMSFLCISITYSITSFTKLSHFLRVQ